MLNNNIHLAELNSSYQKIKARVELYKGSALEKVCNCGDLLSGFTVEKTGEGKFFGFGICQKLKADLIDVDRELNITKDHSIEASFGVGSDFIYPFPNFYIDEINRDEESNLITVTAYDALYVANNHTVSELELPAVYTIRTFAAACARLLNIPLVIDTRANDAFDLMFEGGANFDGTESIRTALNRIAEATQTVYYLDSNWNLYFKRLDKDGAPAHEIHRRDYIDFQNEGEQVLKSLTHTTELGDSVSALETNSDIEEGVSQFIRDNPFLELREDIAELLDNAQAIVEGTVITQFELNWLGNYLLEIGDKVSIEKEDGAYATTYIMDDTVVFDGTLSQTTKWKYDDNSSETADNPTSLGAALNKTFARVDKVNKRIDLVVSDVEGQEGRVAALELTADGLTTTVSNVQKDVTATKNDVTGLKTTTSTHTEEIGALQVSSNNISLRVQKVEEEVKAFEELETGTFIERVAEIEVELNAITSRVSSTETNVTNAQSTANAAQSTANAAKSAADAATSQLAGITETVSTMQTNISQKADAIELTAVADNVTSIDGKVTANTSAISALQINTESINASVKSVEESLQEKIDNLGTNVDSVIKEVNATITSEEARITALETTVTDGVSKVSGMGYSFSSNGLIIDKTESEIKTQITENGMKVYTYDDEVLVANNQGVDATNLRATTFLEVGSRSRFVNFDRDGEDRTACFWIGN